MADPIHPQPANPQSGGVLETGGEKSDAPYPPSAANQIVKQLLYGIVLVILLSIIAIPVYRHEKTLPPAMSSMDFATLNQQTINNPQELASRIFNDALWFHELWIRWLLTDWGLTFFAAGSAVTAAIKNAYSSKSGVQTNLSKMDLLVAILAVGAVLASTFEAKLHASELADQYRYGDLKLQDAKAQYLRDLSTGKSQADATESLFDSWQDAQKHLEGPFAKEKRPSGTSPGPDKPAEKGQNSNAQPPRVVVPEAQPSRK